MQDSTAQQKRHAPWLWTKTTEIEKGWCRVRTRGGLTALVWRDRREVYMLTNMDPTPKEVSFCDDRNHTLKLHIVERYNRHMGYVDNSERSANRYLMSRRTFQWTTKLFFHLLHLPVLNSRMLLFWCGAKYTHQDLGSFCWKILLRKLERAKIAPPPDWLEE